VKDVAIASAGSGTPPKWPALSPAASPAPVATPQPEAAPLNPDQLFDLAYERVRAAKLEQLGASSGAFFLLAPDAKEWKGPHVLVDDEPDFEDEWRQRIAHDKNPDHKFVFLPWG
jgi:hypothetical protein